jgi:hypothetical protein
MKAGTNTGQPKLTDEQVAEYLGLAAARNAAAMNEGLRRRTLLQGVKVRAVERAITQRLGSKKAKGRKRNVKPETQLEIARLEKQLARYRNAAAAAEVDERLGIARASLGSVPGGSASAYGRVVDADGNGRAGVAVEIQAAEGEPVAKTVTDRDGYFAIAAPVAAKGELQLSVASEAKPEIIPLTRDGTPLPAARVRVKSSGAAPPRRRPTGPKPKPSTPPKARPSTKRKAAKSKAPPKKAR